MNLSKQIVDQRKRLHESSGLLMSKWNKQNRSKKVVIVALLVTTVFLGQKFGRKIGLGRLPLLPALSLLKSLTGGGMQQYALTKAQTTQ